MGWLERLLRSPWTGLAWPVMLAPLAFLLYAALTGSAGPDPAKAVVDGTGLWTIRFLLATLAMTPLRVLTGINAWVLHRRMLGLTAACYASLHMLAYTVFLLEGDIGRLPGELVKRPYIVVGFMAWLALLPLALTSTRQWQRRLGRHWLILHKLVYLILILALVHYMWLEKTGLQAMWPYALLGIALLVLRIPRIKHALARSINSRQRAK